MTSGIATHFDACTEDGCSRPHYSNGLCSLCYQKVRKAGRSVRGKCRDCKADASPNRNWCPAHLAKRAAETAAKRKARKGLCSACMKVSPEPGKTRCKPCADARSTQQKSIAARNRADGLCSCGRDPLPNRTRCSSCTEHQRIHAAKRAAEGRCLKCSSKREVGSLCLGHWFRSMARIAGCRDTDAVIALWHSQGGRCTYTGIRLVPGVNASLDHKTARASGGDSKIENLHWVDLVINRVKRDLSHEAFIELCRVVAERFPREAAGRAEGTG